MDAAALKREIEQCLRAGPEQWPVLKQTLSAPAAWILANYDSRAPLVDLMWLFAQEQSAAPSMLHVARRALRLLHTQAAYRKVWERGLDPKFASEWPVCELVVAIPDEEPEDWLDRWIAAWGMFYGAPGRVVALRDDPVWVKFSEYGQPYPPFDWSDALAMIDLPAEDEAARFLAEHYKRHGLDTHF